MNEIAGPATPGVASAPSPYADRGALSEAWYRALYGTRDHPARPVDGASREFASMPAQARAESRVDARSAAPAVQRVATVDARSDRARRVVATVSRGRTDCPARAAVAAHTWRAALARRTAIRFSLGGGAGVALLVQQRGRRLHIIAVATSAAVARHAGAALERARTALAAHGLHVEVDLREKGSA